MIIACRCSECGNIFMNAEDDLCIELDFREQKITFLCRNPSCRYENVMDLKNWKNKQKNSPLPKIGVV